jgi:EAL domain-containing protein (putative c-di-GMP-specific phosphodiesterase class I)
MLSSTLLPKECDATRALLMPAGIEPGFADFPRVAPLDRFIGMQQHRWISDVLAEDRLEVHFQPIIDVQNASQIFAYECLLRGRSTGGDLIAPTELFRAAKQSGLLFQLDLIARRKAVTSIVEHELKVPAMINFTPSSIYDPVTCLRSTVATVRELGLDPRRVIFEIIETETADAVLLKDILNVYRAAGFLVAIDDFGAGYSSMQLLDAVRPDFIKLDMGLIRGINNDPYKAEMVRGFLQFSRNRSIKTITEGIETKAEWEWVRANGADLAQGFYFAGPGSPPPGVACLS